MTFLVIKLSNNTLVWKRLSLIATALNFNHNVYSYRYICITGDRDKATKNFIWSDETALTIVKLNRSSE